MASFNSYVSLPEGTVLVTHRPGILCKVQEAVGIRKGADVTDKNLPGAPADVTYQQRPHRIVIHSPHAASALAPCIAPNTCNEQLPGQLGSTWCLRHTNMRSTVPIPKPFLASSAPTRPTSSLSRWRPVPRDTMSGQQWPFLNMKGLHVQTYSNPCHVSLLNLSRIFMWRSGYLQDRTRTELQTMGLPDGKDCGKLAACGLGSAVFDG